MAFPPLSLLSPVGLGRPQKWSRRANDALAFYFAALLSILNGRPVFHPDTVQFQYKRNCLDALYAGKQCFKSARQSFGFRKNINLAPVFFMLIKIRAVCPPSQAVPYTRPRIQKHQKKGLPASRIFIRRSRQPLFANNKISYIFLRNSRYASAVAPASSFLAFASEYSTVISSVLIPQIF